MFFFFFCGLRLGDKDTNLYYPMDSYESPVSIVGGHHILKVKKFTVRLAIQLPPRLGGVAADRAFAVISPALLGTCNKQQLEHLGSPRLAMLCLIFSLTVSTSCRHKHISQKKGAGISSRARVNSRSSNWAARPGTAILPFGLSAADDDG